MGKTRVYYNGACPVCNAGIKVQRRRMAACGVSDVEWVDVHANPDAVREVGASLEQIRERLYVRDTRGRLNIGADAFAELFSETPGQRWAGRFMRLPIVRQLMRWAYNGFARCLYLWNRANKRW